MLNQGPHKEHHKETFTEHSSHDDEDSSSGGKWWMLVLGLALIIGASFLAVPAWKGYTTYTALMDADVPERYVADMAGLAAAGAACNASLSTAQASLSECTTQSALCAQELNAEKELTTSLGNDLSARGAELTACEGTVAVQESLIADAAKRICCAEKALRDPTITGYTLDGKITCVTEGGSTVAC